MKITKIVKDHKYEGRRLYIANKTFEFIKYIWKDEDKLEKGMENLNIVTYNFLFPNGGLNINTAWNHKKGEFWEKDGKKFYFELSKKSLIVGKFSLDWSLKIDKKPQKNNLN